MHEVNRARLFDLSVDALTLDDVVDKCKEAVRTRRRLLIGVINAAKVVNLRRDPVLRNSLLECDVLLADGQSVVWASRMLGQPLPERVTGIDLFQRLLGVASDDGLSVYLLGASQEVLDAVVSNVRRDHPGVRIAGARDGYFPLEEADTVAADIRASDADMLFLGMTSPKKETFLAQYGDTLGVPVQHGVGGSFDILAGVTKRAPEAWQRIGCEWLYRLLQEPVRLGPRYLRTNTAFMRLVLVEMFSTKSSGSVTALPAAAREPVSPTVIDLRPAPPPSTGAVPLPAPRAGASAGRRHHVNGQ